MARTEHYTTRFEPKGIYHIYNRTVDKKPMFTTPANYQYFLERIKKYLLPVSDVYVYNLLGNHFHLLIRVKDTGEDTAHNTVSHAFQQMFQSYAMAFNRQQSRVGTLFQTPFKRASVNTGEYFSYLIWYIHANPQTHGLVTDFRLWPYGSYNSLISEKPTLLLRHELFTHFGGKEGFVAWHDAHHELLSDGGTLEDW